MLRATERTLHRLKVNHEKYKKSKNKLEAALNTPTHYTFTTFKDNNMRNQTSVSPTTTDKRNSMTKTDINNNNKYSQPCHAKDYILT